MKEIPIYSINSFSEAGPDNFATSIFVGGCNFRCDYCMNKRLVLDFKDMNPIPMDDVKSKIINEKNSEWVNISGGELTIYPTEKIIHLLNEVKKLSKKIAISTNGFCPDKIKSIIDLLDYVTLDIKTDIKKYNSLVIPSMVKGNSLDNVIKTLNLLREKKSKVNNFEYEIRTTLYRNLVGEEEIKSIGSLLKRNERWNLQPFRQAKNMIGKKAYNVKPYDDDELLNILLIAKQYSCNALIRYV